MDSLTGIRGKDEFKEVRELFRGLKNTHIPNQVMEFFNSPKVLWILSKCLPPIYCLYMINDNIDTKFNTNSFLEYKMKDVLLLLCRFLYLCIKHEAFLMLSQGKVYHFRINQGKMYISLLY